MAINISPFVKSFNLTLASRDEWRMYCEQYRSQLLRKADEKHAARALCVKTASLHFLLHYCITFCAFLHSNG